MKENMRIWDDVAMTDPAHTKSVQLGRTFTAIDAHYQIMRATEAFGPVGEGWGYDVTYDSLFLDNGTVCLAIADVVIWWTTKGSLGRNSYGPVRGTNEIISTNKAGKRTVDDDAFKKAMTDALTKGLSHLGFSADVFLGMYDDNKYVAKVKQEFAAKAPPLSDEDNALIKKIKDEVAAATTRDGVHDIKDLYRKEIQALGKRDKGAALALAAWVNERQEKLGE
jgi:hypothetical protein